MSKNLGLPVTKIPSSKSEIPGKLKPIFCDHGTGN